MATDLEYALSLVYGEQDLGEDYDDIMEELFAVIQGQQGLSLGQTQELYQFDTNYLHLN